MSQGSPFSLQVVETGRCIYSSFTKGHFCHQVTKAKKGNWEGKRSTGRRLGSDCLGFKAWSRPD